MMEKTIECEFSPEHYIDILNKIKDRCGTASEKKKIILTHDIDILPTYALDMALIEKNHNIKSTYYIFLHSNIYNALSPESMNIWKGIKGLGHELAFHYDTRYDQKLLYEGCHRIILEGISDNISQHFIDLSPKPDIPPTLEDRSYLSKYYNYHYIADSGGWFRNGCFCKNIDKYEKLLIVCHPIWWMSNLPQVYLDANLILRKGIEWWMDTVNEHRKQTK